MNYVFLAVEWSCYESFKPAAGELVIEDPQCCQCVIANLAQGNMYFVRVYAWNIRGWSKAALSSPAGVIPTCNYTAKSCKVCWCHAHFLTSSLFVHFTAWREVDDVTSQSSLGNITLPISDMDERVPVKSAPHATGATAGVQEKNGDDDAAKQQATVGELKHT